ncbi:MAG: META domain-containing protein [Pseudomonadota bacterium]
MQKTTLKHALAVIAMMLAPLSAFADQLTGTASYRERIALPPEATFRATLYDISNNGQVEIGRFEASGDAGPPYRFIIEYAEEDVVEGGRYSVTTEVIWPDRAYVAAGTILGGFPEVLPELELIMVRPGLSPATPGPGALQPTLQDTYWRLDTLQREAFQKIATEREPYLVLEVSEDTAYRATIGCNRLRGSYVLDGEELTFSPAASTMMACPEPLDGLERLFGEVLAEATGLAI